mmetsp:Transcript_4104/g.9528  ORF Transcript_4104/g.9528 Transcript_4104/m.9528 type:complete len:428 (+) Transcript_4104:105-1388(+)
MRSIGHGFVLLVISGLADGGGVPVFSLTRRLGPTRRLAEEARLYGDLTQLMAFHVDVLVGTPGQLQSVIVDTGSARTAFPCTTCGEGCGQHMDPPFDPTISSTFRWVQCGEKGCDSCTKNQCSYNVKYVEGSEINGHFFEDVLQLGASQRANKKGPVWMGCHTRETKLFRTQVPAGITGLNEGGWNVLESLADGPIEKEVFALCLAETGGSMTVGGLNNTWMPSSEPFQWTPYSSGYHLALNQISFNGKDLFAGNLGEFKLDSGTSFSYFSGHQVMKLEEAIRDAASKRNVSWSSISCLKAGEDEMDRFPNMTFHFGDATFVWRAKGYMFRKEANTWCYAFFTSTRFILGASFMLDHAIIFDREEKKIGFAPSSCPHFASRDVTSGDLDWTGETRNTATFQDISTAWETAKASAGWLGWLLLMWMSG